MNKYSIGNSMYEWQSVAVQFFTGDTLIVDGSVYTVQSVTGTGLVRLEDSSGGTYQWGEAVLATYLREADEVTVIHE